MIITWTKCSEQMPPDGTELILRDVDGCLLIRVFEITQVAKEHLLSKFEFEWVLFTTESWVELNKNNS